MDLTNSISKECIPDDLLEEILLRLPLKSLYRFKCVSKSWYRLISSNSLQQRLPSVTTALFFRSESDRYRMPRYAYTSADGTIQGCSLDFFPFGTKSTVVDGSNGLLLYYSSVQTTFYVVNTVRKSWVSLPRPQKETLVSFLAFDPYSSANYEVVCFTAWRDRGAELEIYSSEIDKWNLHEVHFGINPDELSPTKHYFDGFLYMLAYPDMIVALDLKKFSCNLIRLPEPIKRLCHVGHCRGRLHFSNIDGNKLKIWMMNNLNRSEWGLKYETNLREIMRPRELNSDEASLLVYHPEENLMYVWVPSRLVCYDLEERRLVGTWKFEREKAYMIQIWLFPCSMFLRNCLA